MDTFPPACPWFAGLLCRRPLPLSRLPYRRAYAIFQAFSALAVLTYIFVAESSDRTRAILACALSLPLFGCFLNGQDVTFVMLFLAVALRYGDSKPALAGVALACCSLKYHIFLFLPIAVVAAWRRRLVTALFITESLLFAVSFIVAGPAWPLQYLRQLRSNWETPELMPNLRALTLHLAHPVASLLLLVVVVSVITVAAIVRCRENHAASLAIAVAAGLLITPHAYVPDCAILIPPLVALLRTTTNVWLTFAAWCLLLPSPYILRLAGTSLTYSLQFLLVGFIAAMFTLFSKSPPRERTSWYEYASGGGAVDVAPG
jgi:Glycosyltransferase family 87